MTSKSKYKGGFINGKNSSEYNHDYYIKNKQKWANNATQGDFEEEWERIQNMPEGPEKQQAYKQYYAYKEQADKIQQSLKPKRKTDNDLYEQQVSEGYRTIKRRKPGQKAIGRIVFR